MGCPPVRGDNPRALASGLSYVQVDKHGITIIYALVSHPVSYFAHFLRLIEQNVSCIYACDKYGYHMTLSISNK